MKTKKELLNIIKLCQEALESCGDNYGSEACDNGEYERYWDEKLVDKALKKINGVLK